MSDQFRCRKGHLVSREDVLEIEVMKGQPILACPACAHEALYALLHAAGALIVDAVRDAGGVDEPVTEIEDQGEIGSPCGACAGTGEIRFFDSDTKERCLTCLGTGRRIQ